MMVEVGDRIKLTKACLRGLAHNRLKRNQVKWKDRRGLVIGFSKTADSVSVKWDDRASLDYWPSVALEKI